LDELIKYPTNLKESKERYEKQNKKNIAEEIEKYLETAGIKRLKKHEKKLEVLQKVIYLTLVIANYFKKVFQGYVQLLMGQKKIKLNKINVIIMGTFIIVTLAISIKIGMPRLYII
jgi:hypothetical protein